MMSTVETAVNTPVEPLDDRGSAVRFESQCVVIPDLAHRSRRPRVVTKSYALPLWKKRATSACPAVPPEYSSEESRSHLVLRVPLPTFSLKSHSTARSVDHTPLPPCLIHRCAGFPVSPQHPRALRRPSLSPSRLDVVTVPLRPCCAACQSATDAAAISGEAWPEQFSRGASRRRSVSADGGLRTLTVTGSAASAAYGQLGVSIHVDEIDKRRRSSDTSPSTSRQESPSRVEAGCASSTDPRVPPSPTCVTPATPRIPEEEDDEDEDELFPLPSPKRTPTASPAGSLSSLTVAQISPTPSLCSGDSQPNKRHFLEPPRCSSSSSLSLPKLSESTTDLTLVEDPPRVPSPHLLSAHPSLSGRPSSQTSSPRIACVPPSPTDLFTAPDSTSPEMLQLPEPATSNVILSYPSASHSPTLPHHSPIHMRLPWRSKRSVSADFIPFGPSSSPTVPARVPLTSPHLLHSKKSFSISSPRHIFADVLRGVGAMGSAGMGAGVAL